MTKIRYPRIGCCIPFCRCGSTYYASGEYMCPKHYRLVDKALKAKRRHLRAIYKRRRRGPRAPGRFSWRYRAWKMEVHLWEKMKRQATHRSLGI